jgi:hypothetical protein
MIRGETYRLKNIDRQSLPDTFSKRSKEHAHKLAPVSERLRVEDHSGEDTRKFSRRTSKERFGTIDSKKPISASLRRRVNAFLLRTLRDITRFRSAGLESTYNLAWLGWNRLPIVTRLVALSHETIKKITCSPF